MQLDLHYETIVGNVFNVNHYEIHVLTRLKTQTEQVAALVAAGEEENAFLSILEAVGGLKSVTCLRWYMKNFQLSSVGARLLPGSPKCSVRDSVVPISDDH
jgi:hypothetical protein